MTTVSREEMELYAIRDLIASHIACEEECKAMPTGCGCAMTAARAVQARTAPQAPDTGVVAWRWRYKSEPETNWQHCSARYTPPREAIAEPLGVIAAAPPKPAPDALREAIARIIFTMFVHPTNDWTLPFYDEDRVACDDATDAILSLHSTGGQRAPQVNAGPSTVVEL